MDTYQLTGKYYPASAFDKAEGKAPTHPPTAEYVLLNLDGTIATHYRWQFVKFNDGTVGRALEFLGALNYWTGSFDPNRPALLAKLIPVDQYDKQKRG